MQEASLKTSERLKVKRRNMKNVILFLFVCDMFSTALFLHCYDCTFDKKTNDTCSTINNTRSCGHLNQKGCYVKIEEKIWYTLGCYSSKTECETDRDTVICTNNTSDCDVTCCDSNYCNNPRGQPSTPSTPPIPTSGCDFIGVKTLHHLALSVIASSLMTAM